jgi:cephalosporin hydroxylase
MTDESAKLHNKRIILTKNEFLERNADAALSMSQDQTLQRQANDLFSKADKYRWLHMNSWMGEPIINLPQDMFAIQDIIWRTRPDYVIEVGVAWGGAMLFEATLLELLGGKKVIGVDIFIPEDLKERLLSHGKLSERLELINGSSTSDETLNKIKEILSGSKKVLVILDSHHSHEHVLNELRAYSEFVGKDQYLICGDTIVEYIPEQLHHGERPWGPGNSPATALNEFLSENARFEVDKNIDQRLLLSSHPGGYLKAI